MSKPKIDWSKNPHAGLDNDAMWLKCENSTLRAKIKELEAEVARMKEELAEREAEDKRILDDARPGDEMHCTCVPTLRTRIAELEAALRKYVNEVPLGHQPHMFAHATQGAAGGGEMRERFKIDSVSRWRPVRLAMRNKDGNGFDFVGWTWGHAVRMVNNLNYGWIAFAEDQTQEKLAICPSCNRPLVEKETEK